MSSWLPTILFNLERQDRDRCVRAVRQIVAITAESNAQTNSAACAEFLLQTLMLMRYLDHSRAVQAFGELWNCLADSNRLRPILLQMKGPGDFSVASLLLHAYCGNSSPLESP